MSINSQLRKTKSMDASCLDIRSITEVGSPVNTMSRAKSEYNLNSTINGAEGKISRCIVVLGGPFFLLLYYVSTLLP